MSEKSGDAAMYGQMTREDRDLLEYYGKLWNETSDPDEKAGYHLKAEEIRRKYNYSGGADGSQYVQLSAPGMGTIPTSFSGGGAYGSARDMYDKAGYGELAGNVKKMYEAQTAQNVQQLQSQKKTVDDDAEELARQAYISFMQENKRLPQQLASAGYNGGMADSFQIGLSANLQNNQNTIAVNRKNALQSIDNAIQQAKLAGDLATAQQLGAIQQSAVEQWNQYVSEQESRAHDNYWKLIGLSQSEKDRAYAKSQDTLAQENWVKDHELNVRQVSQALADRDYEKVSSLFSLLLSDPEKYKSMLEELVKLLMAQVKK